MVLKHFLTPRIKKKFLFLFLSFNKIKYSINVGLLPVQKKNVILMFFPDHMIFF